MIHQLWTVICRGLLLLLLLSFWSPCDAVRGSLAITTSQQPNGRLLQSSFGMAEGGIISVKYDITPTSPGLPFNTYFLILLLTEDERSFWYSALGASDSTLSINSMCSAPSWKRILITDVDSFQGTFNMTVSHDTTSTQFSLAVLQCLPGYSMNPITLSVHYQMKNPRPTTPVQQYSNYDVDFLGDYSHLSIQDVMLSRFYGGSIIIYVFLVIGMIGMMWHAGYVLIRGLFWSRCHDFALFSW
jgi:hypothetical protein